MKPGPGLFVVGLIILVLFTHSAADDSIARPLQNYLKRNIGLTQSEMQSLRAGRPVAKLLKTKTNDEVAIFGIIRIHVPQDFFIQRFRNITQFESGTGVEAIGRFHSPPKFTDVANLSIDEDDLEEIPKCRPGDCEIKLWDRAIQHLQKNIDWHSPQAETQAQTVIRQIFVDYVAKYQSIGDDALAIYNDKGKPESVRSGFHKLLQNSSSFYNYDEALANYMEKYPKEKPLYTEDIFYWQKAEFGLKPVVRASHIAIHRHQEENYVRYTIASKMLFASHYFRAAMELKSTAPDSSSTNPGSFYLVCLNRSFVDGLTGLKGAFIRGKVKGKSRDSLAKYLIGIKRKLESEYR